MAEVGTGICLPHATKVEKYHVAIQIEDHVLQTKDPKEAKHGYNRWNERFSNIRFESVATSISKLERIYFYLVNSEKQRICYYQASILDFVNKDPVFKWYPLVNDTAVHKVHEVHEAGMISMKLSIVKQDEENAVDWKKFFAWKKKPPSRMTSYKVRIYIFQCKDLPAADSDGSSDPYITVFNPDGKAHHDHHRTRTVNDTVNPLFYQALQIDYDFLDLDTAPPIVLDCYDTDDGLLDSTDDFLGRAVIHLKEASVAHSLNTYPKLLN